MSDIARLLADDHSRCDQRFAEAENAVSEGGWERAERLFEAFRAALSRHFAAEEEVLFPAFEAHTGMTGGPTWVMRSEHAQMIGLLEPMAAALARRDGAAYLGQAETLLMLMRQHNLKEEQVLYPICDRALGEDTALLAALEQALRPAS
jgi:iron-sulfur cluster repair protein YtfE (RIC family)